MLFGRWTCLPVVFLTVFLGFVGLVAAAPWYDTHAGKWREFSREAAEKGRLAQLGRRISDWRKRSGKLALWELNKVSEKKFVGMVWGQHEILRRVKPAVLQSMARNETELAFLQKLVSSQEMLDMLLLSGVVPEDLSDGLRIWSEIWNGKKENRSGLWLRVGAAVALEWGGNPPAGIFGGEEIDALERFSFYQESWTKGRLFKSFESLGVWEIRQVVGAKLPNEGLKWAQDHPDGKKGRVRLDYANPRSLAPCFGKIPYRSKNKKGKSVHQPSEFYEGKKVTLELLQEYGGVCGAVSRYGMLYAQAHGIPALLLAQPPDHCAFAWKPGEKWEIGNDVHGWAVSRRHEGWVFPWGDQGNCIPLMSRLYSRRDSYRASRVFAWLAHGRPTRAEVMRALRHGLLREPLDYDSWHWLAERMGSSRSALSGWKSDEAHELVEEAADALSDYPDVFVDWVFSCGKCLESKLKRRDGMEVWLAGLVAEKSTNPQATAILNACQRIVGHKMEEEGMMAHWGRFIKYEAKEFYAGLSRRDRKKMRKLMQGIYQEVKHDQRAGTFFALFVEKE